MQSEIAQMICGFKLRQGKHTATDKAWTDAMETAGRILTLTDAKHEAPAEGSGELDPSQANDWLEWTRLEGGSPKIDEIKRAHETIRSALRARSSAPEAIKSAYQRGWNDREDDIIERAERIAPEAREGEAVAWLVGEGGGAIMTRAAAWAAGKRAQGASVTALYTHPAAPSADKLREGDKLTYDMGEGVKIRATYVGPDEGWAKVTFDADGPDAQAVAVRPSRLSPRQSSTPDALKGDAK